MDKKIDPNTTASEALRHLREVIFTSLDPDVSEKAQVQFQYIFGQLKDLAISYRQSEFLEHHIPIFLNMIYAEKTDK